MKPERNLAKQQKSEIWIILSLNSFPMTSMAYMLHQQPFYSSPNFRIRKKTMLQNLPILNHLQNLNSTIHSHQDHILNGRDKEKKYFTQIKVIHLATHFLGYQMERKMQFYKNYIFQIISQFLIQPFTLI